MRILCGTELKRLAILVLVLLTIGCGDNTGPRATHRSRSSQNRSTFEVTHFDFPSQKAWQKFCEEELLLGLVGESLRVLVRSKITRVAVLPCVGETNLSIVPNDYWAGAEQQLASEQRAHAQSLRADWEQMVVTGYLGVRDPETDKPRISVVSRTPSEVKAIVEEIDLQQSSLIATETAVKYGRLVGVQAVVLPTLDFTWSAMVTPERESQSQECIYRLRVIEVETGKLLYTGSRRDHPHREWRVIETR